MRAFSDTDRSTRGVWERFDRTLLQGWVSASKARPLRSDFVCTRLPFPVSTRRTKPGHCGLTSGERQTPDQVYRFNQIGAPKLDHSRTSVLRNTIDHRGERQSVNHTSAAHFSLPDHRQKQPQFPRDLGCFSRGVTCLGRGGAGRRDPAHGQRIERFRCPSTNTATEECGFTGTANTSAASP